MYWANPLKRFQVFIERQVEKSRSRAVTVKSAHGDASGYEFAQRIEVQRMLARIIDRASW
jgi:hypothetical protein